MIGQTLRVCAVCGERKPLRDFTTNAYGYPSFECRACAHDSHRVVIDAGNEQARQARDFLGSYNA